MAVRVGDCIVVQRMERSGRAGPPQGGVFLARDAPRHRWVVLDVRREDSLQLPDESLDAELAGRPGLLVPLRRTHDRGRAVVGLMEAVQPRQSLFAHGNVDSATAALLFAQLVEDVAQLAEFSAASVSLGLLTAHDLVLVDTGVGIRLLVSTGSARRASASIVPQRNLTAVLSQLPLVTGDSPDAGWGAFVRPLVASVQAGSTDAASAAALLREYADRHGPGPEPVVPKPPEPPSATPAPEQPGAEMPVAAEGRRVGPVEIAAGVLGLAALAAFVVVLQSGAPPVGGDGPDGTSSPTVTATPSPTTVRTQAPPVDQPLVGRPCAFYDVGVLDRSGSAVLQCVLQDDGTYVWQNRR